MGPQSLLLGFGFEQPMGESPSPIRYRNLLECGAQAPLFLLSIDDQSSYALTLFPFGGILPPIQGSPDHPSNR